MTTLPVTCERATGVVPADSTPRRLDPSLQLLASGVTTRTVALAVVTSLMAGGVGRLQALPLWAIVLAMVVPAMPVLASTAAQLRRHDGALALFYLLLLAQAGHVLEHLTQVTQLHVLHHTGKEAHGVFGALDVEWVHFIWNAAILLVVVLVLRHYRRNLWLWFALAFAGWHQVEHTYIMSVYLQTAQMGTPGLLSAGGALGGGLPLRRPDLHFLYNVLEATPLLLAFLHQVGQLAGARQAAVVVESRDPGQLTALPPRSRGVRLAPGRNPVTKSRCGGHTQWVRRSTSFLAPLRQQPQGDGSAAGGTTSESGVCRATTAMEWASTSSFLRRYPSANTRTVVPLRFSSVDYSTQAAPGQTQFVWSLGHLAARVRRRVRM